MTLNQFEGIIPYLISPINQETGDVQSEDLRNIVKDLIEKGVHGLSPLGSTGEVHYLSWKQKKEIVKVVIDSADGEVPVIPGVSSYSIDDAIQQIQCFEKMGASGTILILNTYFRLSKPEILHFFKQVSRHVTTPIVLYNNPQFSGVDLTPEIVIELSKETNIKYFKDATGNTGRLLSIVNNAENNLKVFSASAHIPLFVMEIGGVGWMAGPACIFPEQSIRLYELFLAGQWDKAYEIQRKLWKINEVFQKYNLAACIKTALEIQGYNVGDPIAPLSPLTADNKKDIESVITYINESV